jgi:hypothetical protein
MITGSTEASSVVAHFAEIVTSLFGEPTAFIAVVRALTYEDKNQEALPFPPTAAAGGGGEADLKRGDFRFRLRLKLSPPR